MSKNWTYSEGKALIDVYANRKDEYQKTKKKRHFWENILTDLEALNVLESPTTAENVRIKWRTLYRAFKIAKDRGTGTSTSKFMYLKEVEAIFRRDVGISSPYTVATGVETGPTGAPMLRRKRSSESTSSTASESNRKVKRNCRSECESVVELKRKYYDAKLELKKEKLQVLKEHITRTHNEMLHFSLF